MDAPQEFHYRLPYRVCGWRPGAHPGTRLGAGQEFVSHMSLYVRPDPRRLDLRASLRDLSGNWLVRVHRQRASVPVHAIVDVSASMAFGARKTKLQVAADFVEALGQIGTRLGAGQEFVSHMSLYVRPDPRRLDLRASLRDLSGNWLVRVHRQRASVPVHAIVDVSASMAFGARKTKLQVAADFVEALG